MTLAQLEDDTIAWVESLAEDRAAPRYAALAALVAANPRPMKDEELDEIHRRWQPDAAPTCSGTVDDDLTRAQLDLTRLLAEVRRLRQVEREAVALSLRVGEAEALADVARYVGGLVEELIAAAAAEEREACAQIAETTDANLPPGIRKHPAALRADIAAAIRDRA